MKRIVLLLGVVVLYSSCSYQRTAEFIESEYEPYSNMGTGGICGHALLRTPGGDPQLGAGATVYLKPVTTYSTEWFTIVVKGHQHLGPPEAKKPEIPKNRSR